MRRVRQCERVTLRILIIAEEMPGGCDVRLARPAGPGSRAICAKKKAASREGSPPFGIDIRRHHTAEGGSRSVQHVHAFLAGLPIRAGARGTDEFGVLLLAAGDVRLGALPADNNSAPPMLRHDLGVFTMRAIQVNGHGYSSFISEGAGLPVSSPSHRLDAATNRTGKALDHKSLHCWTRRRLKGCRRRPRKRQNLVG